MAKHYIRHVEHGKPERVVATHKNEDLAVKHLAKIADRLEANGEKIKRGKYELRMDNPKPGSDYEFYQVVEFTRPGKYGINW